MVINRNSKAYRAGRFVGKLVLIVAGYVCGKRWGRRPINDFPEK